MENRLVPKAGFAIQHVKVLGFKRKITPKNLLHNVQAATLAVTSIGRAKALLKRFEPDLVIGTGGYVSWPVLRAAAQLKIPTLIHEQNAVPGVTTRKLSAFVDRVMISFEESAKYLKYPQRSVFCGNPVDPAVLTVTQAQAKKTLGVTKPFLLSYGGSLGARPINEAVYQLMLSYSSTQPIRHLHACGTGSFSQWQEKARMDGLPLSEDLVLSDYIYDMPLQMAASDLVICRAGAITLSELAVLGKPAVLIPSPYVTDNHQYKNAKVFADAGAAVLLEEKDLSPQALTAHVERILGDEKLRQAMSLAMKRLARPEAMEILMEQVKELLKAR